MTLNMGVCVGVDASVGVSVGVEGAETEVNIVGAEVSGIDILGVEEDGAGAGVENMMVDWESVNGAESERSSWSDIRVGEGRETVRELSESERGFLFFFFSRFRVTVR